MWKEWEKREFCEKSRKSQWVYKQHQTPELCGCFACLVKLLQKVTENEAEKKAHTVYQSVEFCGVMALLCALDVDDELHFFWRLSGKLVCRNNHLLFCFVANDSEAEKVVFTFHFFYFRWFLAQTSREYRRKQSTATVRTSVLHLSLTLAELFVLFVKLSPGVRASVCYFLLTAPNDSQRNGSAQTRTVREHLATATVKWKRVFATRLFKLCSRTWMSYFTRTEVYTCPQCSWWTCMPQIGLMSR